MATIFGTEGPDNITGTSDPDKIYASGGDDTVNGAEGADTIFGNAGNDSLLGAEGDDAMSGGDGNDTLKGGAGDDLLLGDAGNDALFGGQGNDNLKGGVGSDQLDGGVGDDILNGGKDKDRLLGGSGSDTYLFALDDSLDGDTIQEIADASDPGNLDRVRFTSDVTRVNFFQQGNDLLVLYGDNMGDLDNTVTIKGQFSGTAVERVQLANGQFVDMADINQALADMAAYAIANSITYDLNAARTNADLIAITAGTFQG